MPRRAKVDPYVKDLLDFICGLANEGERALVIGGAARVELALERLLKSVLLPCARDNDELFEANGPLSTVYAKIGMAHRLGLLDDNFERMLQLIRKIRNDFAHAAIPVNLSQSSHRDRLNEVKRCAQGTDLYDVALKFLAENARISSSQVLPPRMTLVAVLGAAAGNLEIGARINKPAKFCKATLSDT
jgi:hypothetical protein